MESGFDFREALPDGIKELGVTLALALDLPPCIHAIFLAPICNDGSWRTICAFPAYEIIQNFNRRLEPFFFRFTDGDTQLPHFFTAGIFRSASIGF